MARILYMATQDSTEYIFGDSITSVVQQEDGVHVAFERSQPRTFDLVVGADGVHYFDSVDQIHMQSWSKGRVALVGDVGYCASPLSGQGTSLALVGAYVLAGELKAAAGDYRMAFASYEKEMREYVELNQKSGATAGKQFIPPTRMGIWLSNQVIRSLPYMPWKSETCFQKSIS